MKTITIQCLDGELIDSIERYAKLNGLEVNDAVTKLLRNGVGLPDVPKRPPGPIGNALDEFFGVWTDEEAEEFNKYLIEARRACRHGWE